MGDPFRSVFWDDYARGLAGLDKRQRRRVRRRIGRMRDLRKPPIESDCHGYALGASCECSTAADCVLLSRGGPDA